jgi:tRNA pseudouridine(55) synthase
MIMKDKVLKLYKNEGETPLECLERLRIENPAYKDTVLSYVGRLDPMAEGLLLVVVDEENKNREEYLKLDKTYEVDVLLGISSDTGDVLGIPRFNPKISRGLTDEELNSTIKTFTGSIILPYPAYSSRPVNGKPLFVWARENKLKKENNVNEIEIPSKISQIKSIDFVGQYYINNFEILKKVNERVSKVNGDFRQKEILAGWERELSEVESTYRIIKIIVECNSGTYMRSLAEKIGEKLGTVALAWKIKRIAVGEHEI